MRYITPKLRIEGRSGSQPPQRWNLAVLGFFGRKASDGLVRALKAKPLDYYIFYGQHVFAESPFAYEATINGKNIIVTSYFRKKLKPILIMFKTLDWAEISMLYLIVLK